MSEPTSDLSRYLLPENAWGMYELPDGSWLMATPRGLRESSITIVREVVLGGYHPIPKP